MTSIAQIDDAEYRLVDLAWRLPAGRHRDDCNTALAKLRKVKAGLLAANPGVLRKGNDEMIDKRSHQAARDQRLHDALREASGGHVCASYHAKTHSGTVKEADARMHALHHSLVDERGVKCDAVNLPPGGMPRAEGEEEGQGTRFDDEKAIAAHASSLTKRLGQPVSYPRRLTFSWDIEGARQGLDAIERRAETDRINKYRRSQSLVHLQ